MLTLLLLWFVIALFVLSAYVVLPYIRLYRSRATHKRFRHRGRTIDVWSYPPPASHSHARENARRVRQMNAGMLTRSNGVSL